MFNVASALQYPVEDGFHAIEEEKKVAQASKQDIQGGQPVASIGECDAESKQDPACQSGSAKGPT